MDNEYISVKEFVKPLASVYASPKHTFYYWRKTGKLNSLIVRKIAGKILIEKNSAKLYWERHLFPKFLDTYIH